MYFCNIALYGLYTYLYTHVKKKIYVQVNFYQIELERECQNIVYVMYVLVYV